MSKPILINPFTTDSTKIISSTAGFLKIAPDAEGNPQFLISPDLKMIFRVMNGFGIPIFDKSFAGVTFDVGGDKTFANAEGVPGFTGLLTAYKGGAGGTIEQLSGFGKMVTVSNATDHSFFAANNSMGTGEWKVGWDYAYDSIPDANNNFQTAVILNSLHTVAFEPDASDNIVQFVLSRFDASNATIRFQYVNTGGVPTNLFQMNGGLPFGQVIRFSLAKDATNFVFIFDEEETLGSKVVKTIAISSVIATRPNSFFLVGDPYNTAFTHSATTRIDRVEGLV